MIVGAPTIRWPASLSRSSPRMLFLPCDATVCAARLTSLTSSLSAFADDGAPVVIDGEALIAARYPIYTEADVTVLSRDVPQDQVAGDIIDRLIEYLTPNAPSAEASNAS